MIPSRNALVLLALGLGLAHAVENHAEVGRAAADDGYPGDDADISLLESYAFGKLGAKHDQKAPIMMLPDIAGERGSLFQDTASIQLPSMSPPNLKFTVPRQPARMKIPHQPTFPRFARNQAENAGPGANKLDLIMKQILSNADAQDAARITSTAVNVLSQASASSPYKLASQLIAPPHRSPSMHGARGIQGGRFLQQPTATVATNLTAVMAAAESLDVSALTGKKNMMLTKMKERARNMDKLKAAISGAESNLDRMRRHISDYIAAVKEKGRRKVQLVTDKTNELQHLLAQLTNQQNGDAANLQKVVGDISRANSIRELKQQKQELDKRMAHERQLREQLEEDQKSKEKLEKAMAETNSRLARGSATPTSAFSFLEQAGGREHSQRDQSGKLLLNNGSIAAPPSRHRRQSSQYHQA